MSVPQPDVPSVAPEWDDAGAEWSAAFAAICDRHRGRLIRWLTGIFGPRDAEDIAQEALARLYSRPGTIDSTADAWPWLAVVARNVGRDLARHNAMSTTVDNTVLATIPAARSVADEVLARDDAVRLARALRALTPRERAVIRLRDFEGATIADIAEILGTNENAVRQQLFRARRRLANAYVAGGGDRRLGLVALAGLRLRELLRRYGDAANGVTATTATLLAGVAPSLAVAAGVTLNGISASPAPVRTPALRYAAAAEPDVPHGTARHRAAPSGAGAGARVTTASRAHRQAPAPPLVTDHREVGPASSDVHVYRSPFSKAGGDTDEYEIWVDLPNGWRWGIHGRGYKDEGYGPVCSSGVVDCG